MCDAADKQRKIERELREITGQWQQAVFTFQEWKQRCVCGWMWGSHGCRGLEPCIHNGHGHLYLLA